MMTRREVLFSLAATCLLGRRSALFAADQPAPGLPNIVYIVCDDLGYGDVHALNLMRGRISTPNFDKLVEQGMHFTNAHACSSVCTPSRYGILTGRYSWRSRLQKSIVHVYDPPLIAEGRLTVAGLLKQNGYYTAGFGKWHLGWGLPLEKKYVQPQRPIADGPCTRGFDEYNCIDMRYFPPYMYVENDRFAGKPLRDSTRMSVKSSWMLSDDDFVDVLPKMTDWTVDFIKRHAADKKPFFAYVAPMAPHLPLSVSSEFKGKSGLHPYADFVMQTDAEIGRIMAAIDQAGIAENTMVIFTSDNGCTPFIEGNRWVPFRGIREIEAKGHFASEQSRGYKADLWDGGHRIPFIVRWPAKVKPGSKCDQLVCLTDFMATCADIVGTRLPDNAGEDSVSILSLLKGQQEPVRPNAIHHSITGKFSIREGKWKLLLCPGSGGWTEPDDFQARKKKLPEIQLYDIEADVAEKKNLYNEYPEVVERLTKLLAKQVDDGRSTPGAPQKNDVPVDLWKKPKGKTK